MMKPEMEVWIPAESKSALMEMLANDSSAGELVTTDPNTWGYLHLPNDRKLVVGYANLGLQPVIIVIDDEIIIGIDELLVGFNKSSFARTFAYRMPTIFHEFVSASYPLIVRDEIGFVCLSKSGKELWRQLTNGPIEKFSIWGGWLRGETIDGEKFSFQIAH